MYLVIQNVDHDPAFNCWVKHMLREGDRIVSKVRQRGANKYAKTTMKFRIDFPETVDQALDLGKKNGITLLADEIAKEMKNVRVDFEIR